MVGGLRYGWTKLNVIQRVGFVRLVAPLLILRSIGNFCFSVCLLMLFRRGKLSLLTTKYSKHTPIPEKHSIKIINGITF
jgi:hypothetical protein